MKTEPNLDAALAYLRNINTRPGPNAGRSIDPTKPGPDADRIAELEREIAEAEGDRSHRFHPVHDKPGGILALRAELSRLRNEQPKGGDAALKETNLPHNPMPQGPGDSAKSPGPQDVRAAVASVLRRYGIAKSSAEHVAAQVLAALAQSDAEPVNQTWRDWGGGDA